MNAEKIGFTLWIASNDIGEPICLSGNDGGLSLTCYYDEHDAIVGVVISQETEVVGAYGLVPGERMMEEIEFLIRNF